MYNPLPHGFITHERDGVPCLVQSLRYCYPNKSFLVVLWDGSEIEVMDEYCTPHLGLCDWPKREEYADAAVAIEKIVRAQIARRTSQPIADCL